MLNHDVLAPGAGFDSHRHSGVHLVTYVVSGALAHHDSTGHAAVVRAGEVQVLTAGDGVTHSERNASATEPVEYVQMWLRTVDPVTAYRGWPATGWSSDGVLATVPEGALRLVVLRAPQDRLRLGGEPTYAYVLEGPLTVDGERVDPGDAVLVRGRDRVELGYGGAEARLLAWELFDPPRFPHKGA